MQNNKLMIFDGNNVEVFEYEGKVLFNPKDVASILEIGDSATRMAISKMNERQVIKLKNSNVKDIDFRKLHNTGENFLTESGVYRLIMRSSKPEAERFQDWVTDEVLPTIRKTGGYINNTELMVNTYFGACDEGSKSLVRGLLTNIEEQQKKILTLGKEVQYKEDIILGLTTDIGLAEKRQRINQIVRHNSKKYAERYNLLYSEFEKFYHVDINRRLNNAKENKEVKASMNKMEYICIVMDMTNQLYDLTCKVFESDFINLLDEWREIVVG